MALEIKHAHQTGVGGLGGLLGGCWLGRLNGTDMPCNYA